MNLHAALSGSAPGPFCGDGNCDPGETPCNCPGECGSPPSTETNCSDVIDNDCDGLIDCDDPDCSSDPNCAAPPPPPPPPPGGAFVDCVTYTTTGGQNKHLRVTIKIVDGANAPVSGASVSITLSGNTTASGSGTTGSTGEVAFTLNNAANTCWTTSVTNVSASGLTWDGQTPPNGFRKGTDPTPDADCRDSNDPCG